MSARLVSQIKSELIKKKSSLRWISGFFRCHVYLCLPAFSVLHTSVKLSSVKMQLSDEKGCLQDPWNSTKILQDLWFSKDHSPPLPCNWYSFANQGTSKHVLSEWPLILLNNKLLFYSCDCFPKARFLVYAKQKKLGSSFNVQTEGWELQLLNTKTSLDVCFTHVIMQFCIIDQVCSQDGWILAKFSFACLWTETELRSINSQK